MADACFLCPDYIKAAVRKPVEEATNQVTSVTRRAQFINAALTGIVGDAIADVLAIVGAIPIPPVLNLLEIVSIIACPLTPLALALDATVIDNLDPKEVYSLVQRKIEEFTKDVIADYEFGLEGLASAKVVLVAKRFLDDLLRVKLDAVLLAEAVAITAFVQGTCPDEFNEGPYQAFLDATTGFSLNGVVPSGLDSDVNGLVVQLQAGNTKIVAWTALASAPAPF